MSPIQGTPNLSAFAQNWPSIEAAASNAQATPDFKDMLVDALQHVNAMQNDADQAVEQLMTGGDVNAAEVLTAVQKADLTFRMMLQVRNKLVQAYQEVKEIRI